MALPIQAKKQILLSSGTLAYMDTVSEFLSALLPIKRIRMGNKISYSDWPSSFDRFIDINNSWFNKNNQIEKL